MPAVVYTLCALTSFACALLLVRGYIRSKTPLLFWSAVSFTAFAMNNLLLFLDFVIFPDADLTLVRTFFGCIAGISLVYGLIKETLGGAEAV